MNPFGPVLAVDLRRLGRQERYFWVRTGYGLSLLGILLVMFLYHPLSFGSRSPNPALAADLAQRFALVYLLVQFMLVVLLTPAVAGSAITEEKERHTLDDLLTTHLRDHEIVLGKFVARTIHLALVLLTGLPILSLVVLLGGVSPGLLWGGFAAAGVTLLSVASLSLCISVYAHRSARVFTRVYVILIGYFLLWALMECWEYVVWGLPPFAWDRPRLPLARGGWTVWPAALLEVLNAGNFLEAYKAINSHIVSGGGTYSEVLPVVLTKYAAFHAVLALTCLSRAVVRFREVALSQGVGSRYPGGRASRDGLPSETRPPGKRLPTPSQSLFRGERLQDRLSRVINAAENLNLLLRLSQQAVTVPQELDAVLVAGERVLQPELAVLQLLHDFFQVGQSLFKSAGRLIRGFHGLALASGTTSSTRLISLPSASRVTIRWPDST